MIPSRIYLGATKYHPEIQWLLEAFDLEKKAMRTFAVKDMSAIVNVSLAE